MRKLAQVPGLHPILICYMEDEVKNDLVFFIHFINNCDSIYNFYYVRGDSSFRYRDYIGENVLLEPIFWETLNNRILEFNKEKNCNFNLFDIEKELSISRINAETKKYKS